MSPSIVSCINLIDKLAEFYIELHMSAVPLKSEAFGRFENSLLQRINFEILIFVFPNAILKTICLIMRWLQN